MPEQHGGRPAAPGGLKKSHTGARLARRCGSSSRHRLATRYARARSSAHGVTTRQCPLRFEKWPAIPIWYVQRIVARPPKFAARPPAARKLEKRGERLPLCRGVVVAVKLHFRAHFDPQQENARRRKQPEQVFSRGPPHGLDASRRHSRHPGFLQRIPISQRGRELLISVTYATACGPNGQGLA